jgi:hypothetical protein
MYMPKTIQEMDRKNRLYFCLSGNFKVVNEERLKNAATSLLNKVHAIGLSTKLQKLTHNRNKNVQHT